MPIVIYTSSFFTKLPVPMVGIGVARSKPRGMQFLPEIADLSPGPWFRSVDADEYRKRYMAQLSRLDPREVVAKVEDLAAGRPAALLCWERPREKLWCHRAYISIWLKAELGLDVYEYGLEDEGAGEFHPKLPEEHRAIRQQALQF